MTSLRDFAKLLNDIDGTKLNHTGAKRRLENIGATPDDLKNPDDIADLVAMCKQNPNIWSMYKEVKSLVKGVNPVENERIKQLEFQNVELRKALAAVSNVIGESPCK